MLSAPCALGWRSPSRKKWRSILWLSQDDSMAMGARKAFEEIPDKQKRYAWLSLAFTGCDGTPSSLLKNAFLLSLRGN